jgi:hypothetical protein
MCSSAPCVVNDGLLDRVTGHGMVRERMEPWQDDVEMKMPVSTVQQDLGNVDAGEST